MQPQLWYKRHCVLLGLSLLLLIQWGCWRFLQSETTTWTLRDDSSPRSILPTPLKSIIYDPLTSSFQTGDTSAYISWPASTVAGIQFVKLIVTTEGINTLSLWTLQYTTGENPFFDDEPIHARSLRPLLTPKGGATVITWHLPVAAESVRIVIPPASHFELKQLHLAGYRYAESAWHTWQQAFKMLCIALNASLFVYWLAQYFGLLRRLCVHPVFISSIILGLHGTL